MSPTNNSSTLRSILCGEEFWSHDDRKGRSIIFREDGTGDLHCRIEFWTFIAAEFHWHVIVPDGDADTAALSLDSPVEIGTGDNGGVHDAAAEPQLLGHFTLEMTLTTQLSQRMRSRGVDRSKLKTNEDHLTDEAFQPRQCQVRLERGRFRKPEGYSDGLSELRLVFEPSPMPPRHMWKAPHAGPESLELWEIKEFLAHEVVAG